MEKAELQMEAKVENDQIVVKVTNASANIALFNELKLLNSQSEWVVPSLFSDNYFSLLPNEEKTILIELPVEKTTGLQLLLKGKNTNNSQIGI
jgi:mannosylglycoprotein endo-beta-mannosidase